MAKKKADPWNQVDDATLAQKFRSGALNPNKLETEDIKKAHQFWVDKK